MHAQHVWGLVLGNSCIVRNVQAPADQCDNGVHEACWSTGPLTSKWEKTDSRGVDNGWFSAKFPASSLILSFPTVKSLSVFPLNPRLTGFWLFTRLSFSCGPLRQLSSYYSCLQYFISREQAAKFCSRQCRIRSPVVSICAFPSLFICTSCSLGRIAFTL